MNDNYDELLVRLTRIETLLTAQQKKYLTVSESAAYLGVNKGVIYKAMSKIRHYKPGGKKIYFLRKNLDEYVSSGLILSDKDVADIAASFCHNN